MRFSRKPAWGLLIIAQKPWDQQLQGALGLSLDVSGIQRRARAAAADRFSRTVFVPRVKRKPKNSHTATSKGTTTRSSNTTRSSPTSSVPPAGYESYKAMQDALAEMGADGMAAFYKDLQVWGTPEQCLEKVIDLREKTGCTHTSYAFGYAGMPYETATRSMELFASEVLPELQKLDS